MGLFPGFRTVERGGTTVSPGCTAGGASHRHPFSSSKAPTAGAAAAAGGWSGPEAAGGVAAAEAGVGSGEALFRATPQPRSPFATVAGLPLSASMPPPPPRLPTHSPGAHAPPGTLATALNSPSNSSSSSPGGSSPLQGSPRGSPNPNAPLPLGLLGSCRSSPRNVLPGTPGRTSALQGQGLGQAGGASAVSPLMSSLRTGSPVPYPRSAPGQSPEPRLPPGPLPLFSGGLMPLGSLPTMGGCPGSGQGAGARGLGGAALPLGINGLASADGVGAGGRSPGCGLGTGLSDGAGSSGSGSGGVGTGGSSGAVCFAPGPLQGIAPGQVSGRPLAPPGHKQAGQQGCRRVGAPPGQPGGDDGSDPDWSEEEDEAHANKENIPPEERQDLAPGYGDARNVPLGARGRRGGEGASPAGSGPWWQQRQGQGSGRGEGSEDERGRVHASSPATRHRSPHDPASLQRQAPPAVPFPSGHGLSVTTRPAAAAAAMTGRRRDGGEQRQDGGYLLSPRAAHYASGHDGGAAAGAMLTGAGAGHFTDVAAAADAAAPATTAAAPALEPHSPTADIDVASPRFGVGVCPGSPVASRYSPLRTCPESPTASRRSPHASPHPSPHFSSRAAAPRAPEPFGVASHRPHPAGQAASQHLPSSHPPPQPQPHAALPGAPPGMLLPVSPTGRSPAIRWHATCVPSPHSAARRRLCLPPPPSPGTAEHPHPPTSTPAADPSADPAAAAAAAAAVGDGLGAGRGSQRGRRALVSEELLQAAASLQHHLDRAGEARHSHRGREGQLDCEGQLSAQRHNPPTHIHSASRERSPHQRQLPSNHQGLQGQGHASGAGTGASPHGRADHAVHPNHAAHPNYPNPSGSPYQPQHRAAPAHPSMASPGYWSSRGGGARGAGQAGAGGGSGQVSLVPCTYPEPQPSPTCGTKCSPEAGGSGGSGGRCHSGLSCGAAVSECASSPFVQPGLAWNGTGFGFVPGHQPPATGAAWQPHTTPGGSAKGSKRARLTAGGEVSGSSPGEGQGPCREVGSGVQGSGLHLQLSTCLDAVSCSPWEEEEALEEAQGAAAQRHTLGKAQAARAGGRGEEARQVVRGSGGVRAGMQVPVLVGHVNSVLLRGKGLRGAGGAGGRGGAGTKRPLGRLEEGDEMDEEEEEEGGWGEGEGEDGGDAWQEELGPGICLLRKGPAGLRRQQAQGGDGGQAQGRRARAPHTAAAAGAGVAHRPEGTPRQGWATQAGAAEAGAQGTAGAFASPAAAGATQARGATTPAAAPGSKQKTLLQCWRVPA